MWHKKAQEEKTLIIMRGLPGSAKSTLARQIAGDGIIFSTDDFWGENYDYDSKKIKEAHEWNQKRTHDAMQEGITPIIIDNTNVSDYEARPYFELAKKHGYKIEIKKANMPWSFDVEELAKKNTHKVPKETIQEMLDRWSEDFSEESVLNSKAPWE